MPTYVYRCSCGHEFELFLSMSKVKATTKCEKCGRRAKRMMGAPGVVFKGGGFYSSSNPSLGATRLIRPGGNKPK